MKEAAASMEVTLAESENLPEGCLLSIRAGTTRRQAPADPDKFVLRFPKGQLHADMFKVDALMPIGNAVLGLEPGRDRYDVSFGNKDGLDLAMKVTLLIREAVQAAGETSTPVAPDRVEAAGSPAATASRRHRLAVSAQSYLNRHGLLKWAQVLFQELIKDQPDDPWAYIDARTNKARSRAGQKGDPEDTPDSLMSPGVMSPGGIMSPLRPQSAETALPERGLEVLPALEEPTQRREWAAPPPQFQEAAPAAVEEAPPEMQAPAEEAKVPVLVEEAPTPAEEAEVPAEEVATAPAPEEPAAVEALVEEGGPAILEESANIGELRAVLERELEPSPASTSTLVPMAATMLPEDQPEAEDEELQELRL